MTIVNDSWLAVSYQFLILIAFSSEGQANDCDNFVFYCNCLFKCIVKAFCAARWVSKNFIENQHKQKQFSNASRENSSSNVIMRILCMISLRKHNNIIKILRQQRNVRPVLSICDVISSLQIDSIDVKQCDCPKTWLMLYWAINLFFLCLRRFGF